MAKRFNNLKAALKSLGPPSAETSVADASPPPGSILDNFHKFYTGAKKVNYERKSASKKKALVTQMVRPFAVANSSTGYKVKVSQRAIDALANLPIGVNELNLSDPVTGSEEKKGFLPARLTVSIQSSSANTEKTTSQITGIKYYGKSAVSYTFPFGQNKDGTTVTYESAVQSALENSLTTSALRKVNFKSEVWR
ncbi:MAG: hypothetical protein SAJ12_07270 [Jaaginema sp. PMC 1079.18]|nr:hypothetical protein [Jaaginema sp. PMC 1080.18]MEC4850797.1 hypothetical protein [Jaaginema sp. PMC 1079.18]MEC4868168.1 hypothetical protein [Jaaginema sp. PMC 1078.18]